MCRRCGLESLGGSKCSACGNNLTVYHWVMTKKLIKIVHVVALRQKGLTREDYELRLNAVGVSSCKEMNQQQFSVFMRELNRLPDAPAPAQ